MVNTNTKKVNKTEIRFTMRMQPELYEQVKQSAYNNKRSIAKEIEYSVEQYFKNNMKF